MAGSEAFSAFAVKIFIEKNELAPVRIGVKLWRVPVHRTVALFVAQENSGEAMREFCGNFGKCEPVTGTRRELDFEIVSEVMMKLLQRFDQ